jgi:hypothetical protein
LVPITIVVAFVTAGLVGVTGANPSTASAAAPRGPVGTRGPVGGPTGGFADPTLVNQWYTITNQTVTAAAFPQPVTQSDAWSVSWLAAARAVDAGFSPSFEEAAFAQALHDTLVAIVPSQQSELDADLSSTLTGIPNGPAKSAGIASGQHQAASALSERADDGLSTAAVDIPYTPPPPAPGVWQSTPPTYGPAIRAGEGNGTTYILARNNQFDPGQPPSLTSRTYLASLAETEAYGSATSTVRTPEETDVALFWEPAINIQYVQFVGELLTDTHNSLAWDTRFVAAFQVVTTDAQIAIYNAKYEYARWRPVTAIREGSPGVTSDPTWTPLFTTPLYPEYPSGHGGYAGAAQAILTAFFGPVAPAPVSATSPTDPGSTHTYTNWAEITQEVINARVWEGIHFRFSDNTGDKVGSEVAHFDLHRLSSIGL